MMLSLIEPIQMFIVKPHKKMLYVTKLASMAIKIAPVALVVVIWVDSVVEVEDSAAALELVGAVDVP